MSNENGNLLKKVIRSISEEGLTGCAVRTGKFVKKQVNRRKKEAPAYRDVLFISGCREDLPHPWRYRVLHQREQLEACGITTGEVYFQELSLNQLRYYRAFIFFRSLLRSTNSCRCSSSGIVSFSAFFTYSFRSLRGNC